MPGCAVQYVMVLVVLSVLDIHIRGNIVVDHFQLLREAVD